MGGFDLREFTVTVDLGRDSTTYWLRPVGRSEAVVSMHKDCPFTVVDRAYLVRPVAEPQQLLGYVKLGTAWDAQEREVGAVGPAKSSRQPERAQIVQHGLGILTPKRDGVSAVAHRAARFVDFLDIRGLPTAEDLDSVLPARVRCAGPTSAGFALTRYAGVTARYEVVVHDPRVSFLLILAYLDRFNAAAEGVRQAIVR